MLKTAISIIIGFFSGKGWIMYLIGGILALAFIGGGYWKYNSMLNEIKNSKIKVVQQSIEINDLNSQIDSLKNINDKNKKATQQLKEKYDKTISSLYAKFEAEKKKQKIVTIIKERIKYVDKKDDGVVAPILSDTLNRLRSAQSTKNNSSSKDKGREGNDTAKSN